MSAPNRQEAIRLGLAVVRDPGIALILNRHAPNLTACPVCSIDDFAHQEGCKLAERVEEIWAWLEEPGEEALRPVELGTIFVLANG